MYFLRAAATGGTQELWSIRIDGSDEHWVADLGRFRAIDRYFDISQEGVVTWAPFHPGWPQVWTAVVE